MLEKIINTVRNPLTVIAVFAGLAEAFSCLALPRLSLDVQRTFIWFVMAFPLLLVFLFFATLNWNHKALYAPSDFKSDDTFLKTFEQRAAEIQHDTLRRTAEIMGELVTISLTDPVSMIGSSQRPFKDRFATERTRLDARNKIAELLRSNGVDTARIAKITEQYDGVILTNVKKTFTGVLNSYVFSYAQSYSLRETKTTKPGGEVVITKSVGDPKKWEELQHLANSDDAKMLSERTGYDVHAIEAWLRKNELYGGHDIPELLKLFSELKGWLTVNGLPLK